MQTTENGRFGSQMPFPGLEIVNGHTFLLQNTILSIIMCENEQFKRVTSCEMCMFLRIIIWPLGA